MRIIRAACIGMVAFIALFAVLAFGQGAKPKVQVDPMVRLQGQVDRWNATAQKAGLALVLRLDNARSLAVGLENHSAKPLRLYPLVFQDTLTFRFYNAKGLEVGLTPKILVPHTGADRKASVVDAGESIEESVLMKVIKRRLSGPEKAVYVMARYQAKSGSTAEGEPLDCPGVAVWSNVIKIP